MLELPEHKPTAADWKKGATYKKGLFLKLCNQEKTQITVLKLNKHHVLLKQCRFKTAVSKQQLLALLARVMLWRGEE